MRDREDIMHVPRRPRWSYVNKVLAASAAAALAPWMLWSLAPVPHADLFAPLAALSTCGALVVVARLLRPISDAAARIRASGCAANDIPEGADALAVVLGQVARLGAKADALQHRWVQRQPVTGLPTREYLLLEIAEDLERAPPPTLLGAIRFADYNRLSSFDPAEAELALRAFADRLVGAIGKDRPVAQVDRDCFAIWFRGSEPRNAAVELQAICYALGTEIAAGERRLVPEIEVGTALYPDAGTDAAALVTRALVTLAKTNAGGRIAPSPGKSAAIARERFALEQDLRHAIGREQLFLEFQPVVDLSKGALIGAEALLRWRHPQAGMISPGRFIPILEDSNLASEIGMWTLNAACREARGWQRRGVDGLKVAVNLSATQLRDDGLEQMIRRTLDRHRLRPQALELELTETAAAEDAERTFALFSEFRAMGISLAIDDFGSGYSSLSYLKNLPFDKLKIDREFIVDVHRRKDSQAICASLVELARGLGISVLAEGVENAEELRFLRGIGCDIFQGFYFSKPLGADDFIRRAADPAWQERLKTTVGTLHNHIENRISA